MMNKVRNKTPSQPPLSHFDKSFSDNPWDVLFCTLNEIEPVIAENKFQDEPPFLQEQIVDPRNKLPVTRSFYNHTIYKKPEIFRCPNRSILNYKEHSLCLSFLQSLKNKQQIYPHQVGCFKKTISRRQEEQEEFHKFVSQYNNASYEKIYAPNLLFAELYQKFYQREMQLLMEKHQDGIFQIHTGFPIPHKCGKPEMLGIISDIESIEGNHNLPLQLDFNADLSGMKHGIQTFFDLYLKAVPIGEEKLSQQHGQFHVSLETLVFLLSAGEYIDTPSDVLIQVVRGKNGENEVHMNGLLPSKNTGPHTAELIASVCSEVFLQMKAEESPEEIEATDFEGPYELQSFDDFICGYEQLYHALSPFPMLTRYSHVKWTLNIENEGTQLHLISRTKYEPANSTRTRLTLPSLKLEYKSKFGCEIMSKPNLLREWLQLQLSNSSESQILRHRIHANTFKTILQENLKLEDIELELEKRYKVKPARLLGSLADFLQLFNNIPPGRFLLRYNPRFQDKLMLYSEVNTSTSKTSVTLHSLMQEFTSDLAFMTLRQMTPIDDTLCTAMHDFYKILPCSFLVGNGHAKNNRRIIDDKTFIEKRAKKEKELNQVKVKNLKRKRNIVKREKKAKKLKQQTHERRQQQSESNELKDEIENDRILFGFE